MPIEIKLPDLGDGIESADVLEVLVAEGDTVAKDQGLIELETDKATATVPSEHAGRVARVHVSDGDTVKVGQVILTLDADQATDDEGEKETEDDASEAKAPEKKKKEKEKESKPAGKPKQPDEPPPSSDAENDEEVGEEVEDTGEVDEEEAGQPQTPRASSRKRSESEKPAKKPPAKLAPEEPEKTAPPKRASKSRPDKKSGQEIAAGPAMRRFARELGVDLGSVTGSGEGGRITRDDILMVVRAGGQRTTASSSGESDDFGPVRREKLSRMRRTIAEQMHRSWTTVPRVTNFDDADVTDLENIRNSSKEDYAARGIKLTAMPFVIKAVGMALRNHPVINASIDMEDGQVTYKEYVNIGIAVDSERGLVVPALRKADTLSIPEIARQLGQLADKVRDGDFSVEDLRGGTFTISNLGAIGGTWSTPIINVPETAVLLIGRSRKLPVVLDEIVVPRLMMPLSISYDHRLIDGAAAARFLNDVIGYLEAPSRLLLAP